jgi:hypothetical protein
MAQRIINVGTIANDGTGDSLRTGAEKINDNFTELYEAVNNEQLNADWTAVTGVTAILNKPTLFSGDYEDLTSKPALADVALSGSYNDLADQPHLSLVATTGSYNSLSNLPILFSGSYSDLSNKPTLFSGSYNDLTNTPTIPNNTNQLINGAGFITGVYVTWGNVTSKPSFATVATSGNYNDLSNKPTAYTLPTASTSVLGGVKIDGSSITMDINGVISASGGGGSTLPANAAGFLNNNGSGILSWQDIEWSDVQNRPAFSIVATSGLYTDLSGTPDSILDFGITDGSPGQVLTTNGSGVFTFTTAGSGTLASRSTASGTTATLANAATGNLTITGFKSYMLLKIVVSHAAWVRVYTDSASRTADASRAEGSDPAPGAGVIAEAITTGSQTILISPGALGFNNETVPTTNIELAVTNKSGSSAAVTVVLHLLKLEN